METPSQTGNGAFIEASVTNTGIIGSDTTTSYDGTSTTLDNKGLLTLVDGATLTDNQTLDTDSGGPIQAAGSA